MEKATGEVKKKKTRRGGRRGGRGSGKGKAKTTSLEEEIKELVKKELQKYEEQLQGLSNFHNSLVKQNDSASFKKDHSHKVQNQGKTDKIMKMKRNLTGKNNLMVQQADNVNNKPNGDKVVDKQSQKSKRDARSHYFKSILRNMSQIKVTDYKPKNSPQDSQNFGFPKSIKRDKMKELLVNQNKSKQYVTGTMRINNKQSQYAYVTCEKDDDDILIQSHADRNRAMEKDFVAVKINPKDKWVEKTSGNFQKTGFVVSILEKVHSRTAVGVLMHYKETLKFQPRDPRFPILTIDPETLPEEYKEKNNLKKILFNAKIINWSAPSYCTGKILGIIGDVGDLEAETEAILLENGLDVTPYDEKLLQNLPPLDYQLQENDLLGREDWRSKCIFTIDPATAVDLDDAVSCDKLPNGNFEVGVHIADVTHFLEASTPLDKKISKRATTIYLANTAHHMLPKALTQLCSLLPGKDRLAFSVIWEMTPLGEIKSHRFTRTIMNSCFQMSYQQAQRMIENPHFDWSEVDLPSIENGFTSSDISEVVQNLFRISRSLRSKRFEGGALKIDQPKLRMIVDEATKLPVSFYLEERLGSNELIEEFMLLANTTVANHLYKRFPKTALLRHHNQPKPQSLEKAFDTLKNFGVHLNTESAGALQASMAKYEEIIEKGSDLDEEKFVAHCRMMVMNALCAQAMVRANYICSGNVKKKVQLKHYALNIPLYTHFTSPIRRYADCVVHRLLSSSLEDKPMHDDWSRELCANLAKNCNRMKDSARNAQEKSNEIYFAHLLAQKGPTESLAIVMNARHQSLDVILCHVGLTVRIELSELQDAIVESSDNDTVETIKIHWKGTDICQIINVFTILNVRIRKHPKSYKIHTTLIAPRMD